MAWWNFKKTRGTEASTQGLGTAEGRLNQSWLGRGTHSPTGRKGIGHKGDRALAWDHLADFTSSRIGVEAYIEPETNVTKPTICLIATNGEWTRRQLLTAKEGWDWARKNQIPVYDVQQTGYPNRMREWNAKAAKQLEREEQRAVAERLRALRDRQP